MEGKSTKGGEAATAKDPTTTPQTARALSENAASSASTSVSQAATSTMTISTSAAAGEAAAPAVTSTTEDSSAALQLSVPPKPETSSEPTTLQLVLSAREAAETKARAEAEAAAASIAEEASPRRTADATLKLPHLREPTKEPEPTDPDFTVRLGAFMERAGEDSFHRLLQKEFPEPDIPTRLLERARTRLSSTPTSPLSPTCPLSPSLSPVATPRELKWSTGSQGGSGAGVRPRRASLTLRRRRESTQLQKGPEYLAPVPGSYITESESGFARFQRVSRTVKIVVKVCNALKSFVERTDTEGWSFVEMYLHMQQGMRQDLAFNPQNFTKAQPLNGGPRLQKLLAIPPEQRTSLNIQHTLAILRGHSGFNDFPMNVQIQMCRAMHYELYESRRILLHQGHQPTAFYMLLTGSLMVNIQDVHPSTGHVFIRTVSDLKEGDCFGELALMEQTPRTATIICKTVVELLSVPKEDFDRIIRRPLLQQRDNNILHCQRHLLFQDFPCDIFYDNPEGFFFQYCPAGLVVVKNGQRCAYIVFVKSGKCHLVGSYNSSELTRRRLDSASREMQKAFPLYTEVLKMAPPNRKRPGTHPDSSSAHDRMEVDLLTQVLGMQHSTAAAEAKRDLGVRVQEYVRPPPPPLQKSRTLSNFYDKLQKERRQKLMKSEDPGTEALESFWSYRLQGPVLHKPKSVRIKADFRPTTVSGQNIQRLEFLRPDKEGFAQIAELSAGDVFGLETLVKRQASRVSVVSQGAELIFISKRLFLQHANIRVLRIVNDMSITYPSAVDIHSQLKYRREWSRYKHALVRHVVTRVGRSYEPPSCRT